MTNWIYQQTEPGLFTVGFYTPGGEWKTDSDFNDRNVAADRVHYLNGGSDQQEAADIEPMDEELKKITLNALEVRVKESLTRRGKFEESLNGENWDDHTRKMKNINERIAKYQKAIRYIKKL